MQIFNIPNIELIGSAFGLFFVALAIRAVYQKYRRPKFLYGERQSVSKIQRARRMKMLDTREDLESRHFLPN
jgi:hypothetical protein